MASTDVHILGVKHTDDRIHDRIDEEAARVDGPDVVYHEWPGEKHDRREFVKWIALKNPAVVGPAALYTLTSVLKMGRGISVDDTGTAHIKSECKVAAERLRDEYDADLVNIGMNRIDLLKERSWVSAAQSWGIVLLALWVIFYAITIGTYAHLWALIVPFALSMIDRKRTLDKVRPTRDEHMATTAIADFTDRGSDRAFVIVGQKHVEGITTRFGAEGIPPVCRWISNECDNKS